MDIGTYKNKEYEVLYLGPTKYGRRAKLGFLGGAKTFWVDAHLVSTDEAGEDEAEEQAPQAPIDPWDAVQVTWSASEKRWEARNCFPIYKSLKALDWVCIYDEKLWHTSKPDRMHPELLKRLTGAPLAAYNGAVEEVAALEAKAEAAQAELLADFELDLGVYPTPPGLPLYTHQDMGVRFMFGKKEVIIGDDAGVGKTPQALVSINATESIKTVLIIVPANLRLLMADEWERWIVPDGREWHLHVAMTGREWPTETNAIIISWALARKDGIWEKLMAVEWDLIVADEIHYAKNETRKTALRFYGKFSRARGSYGDLTEPGLIHQAKRIWMMSGTLMPNGRPAEMWTVVRGAGIFRSDQWRHYHVRYCDGHKVSHGSGTHWDISGSSNEEELSQILKDSGVFLRRRITDVLDLPPKQRTVIPLHVKGIAGALRREENSLKALSSEIKELEALVGQAADEEDEEAEQALGGRIKTLREALFGQIVKARHRTTLLKLPAVISYLKGLLHGGNGNGEAEGSRLLAPGDEEESEPLRIVVFGWFRDVLEKIHEAFPEESVLFYGGSSPAEKKDALIRFQGGVAGHGDAQDPKCRLFITNPRSGGVGLTLTRSNLCVFVELDWSPGVITQAEGRIYRQGQKAGSVLVHHLVLRNSIDERLAYSLIEKQKAVAAVVGDDPSIIPPLTASDTGDILSAMLG